MKVGKRKVLFFTAAASGIWSAHGQEMGEISGVNTQKVSSALMAPVMVTSTLTEMELKEVPLSVAVVTSEEIFRSAGATVGEVLRDVPGVEIFDGGMAGMSRVSIRGESSRTLVLVDGQRISEQKAMSGAPMLISKADIERIEVVKGPGSTLYGSEAIGGVVNIITKKAAKDGLHVSVGGSYHSGHNGAAADISVSGKEGPFSYYASVMTQDYGRRDTPVGKVDRTDSDAIAYTIGAGYDRGDLSGGIRFETFDSSLSVYTGSDHMYMDLPEWSRRKLSGFIEKKEISEHVAKVRLSAYYQNTVKEFINDINWARPMGFPPFVTWTEYKETRNDHDSFGLNLQSDFIFGNHYLIAGVDIVHDRLKADDYSGFHRMAVSAASSGRDGGSSG
jgi:hemoglobin/transferrin/lactoferrin receptor protein